jgi:hypothetical protein
MKKILFFLVVVFNVFTTQGQQVENTAVNGKEVFEFIAKEGYKYPSFQKGKVFFTNSDPGGGRLNYNYLLQTMQFLGDKGDTLVFADESNINYIGIGSDTFFYNRGFFEKLAGNSKSKLFKKSSLKVNEPQKLGAFGKAAITTNVVSTDLLRGDGSPYNLDINEEFRFVKKTSFYVSLGNKEFKELNKRNIEVLFSDKATQVNDFITEHKINLNNEQDVLTLFAFINLVI